MPRKKRQYSLEDKLHILEEARQPNTTVAEVLRRHQVDPTTFYRWEQQAKEAIREALSRDRRRTESVAKDREIERLRAELMKKSRVIAEVIEENLDLKKTLSLGAKTRYTAQEKDAVLRIVAETMSERAGACAACSGASALRARCTTSGASERPSSGSMIWCPAAVVSRRYCRMRRRR